MPLLLKVGAASIPSDWSSNRLPAETAVLTMMEGTRTPAARRRAPTSPATNRSTEKPSRDGGSSSTLAD